MVDAILGDGVGERDPGAPGRFSFDPQVVRPRPVADDMRLHDSVEIGMRKYGESAGSTWG